MARGRSRCGAPTSRCCSLESISRGRDVAGGMEQRLGPAELQVVTDTSGGTTLRQIAAGIVSAVDPKRPPEEARKQIQLAANQQPTAAPISRNVQQPKRDA